MQKSKCPSSPLPALQDNADLRADVLEVASAQVPRPREKKSSVELAVPLNQMNSMSEGRPRVGSKRALAPKAPMKKSKSTSPPPPPLQDNPEFREDVLEVGRRFADERSHALRIGELALKWIASSRYSHQLNAGKFAEYLKAIAGVERSRRTIREYIAAYKEHQLHVKHDLHFPNLGVAHLALIAASRCPSEAERIELARRVDAQQAPVSKIMAIAVGLHAEAHRQGRHSEVSLSTPLVRRMDGLDLLREQADGSVEVAVLDWQWSHDEPWSQNAGLPRLAHPDDPVRHLAECLFVGARKLFKHGLVLLHYRPSAFLPVAVQTAIEEAGLRDAGEFIWAKSCGGFQDAATPLMPGHEKVILLCKKDVTIKSCSGGVSSVSPRWTAPTRANSGEQRVHPHQKPVELYEALIGVGTVNGLVVDAFAGSGSAGVAAVRLGCSYQGAELIGEYVEIANRRIALAKGRGDAVEQAANRFLATASPSDAAAINAALGRCGLQCVSTVKQEVAA
jgi:hypothetical protein